MRLGPDDEVDVHRFERMTAQAYANGPLLRADKLREALALFRGEPLADFGYDSFAHGESHRLEELRLDALEERIEADLQLNRHVQMLPELERFGAGTARRRYEALRHRHVPARARNWAWDGTYSFNSDD